LSQYQTLLRVAVEHSYNLNGVCACLNFSATEKTRTLLANAGLLVDKTIDGIRIAYDKTRLEALELYAQDLLDPLSFDFKVYSIDPDFKSYTEPYAASAEGILYFDNLAASGPGKQKLSVSKYVSRKDFKSPDSIAFKDVLSQKDYLLPPEFVLRIFAGNKEGSLLNRWLEPDPITYSIAFDCRQRYWKYYLLGKLVRNNKSSKGFCVVDPDKQVEFEATGQELLADRRVAYTFRSKQPIPLNEHYPFRFQLKQQNQGNETVVIHNLPVASVRQAGTDMVAEQATVVSEIYINS